MTDKLPPNLLALFQPRPPLRWLNPSDKAPEDRRTANIDGVAKYVAALQEKKEEAKDEAWTESVLERTDREKFEQKKKQQWLVTKGYKDLYKPLEDPNIRGDAFKTLFVGRLPYDCSVKDLENEFSRFGPLERIRIVTSRNGKPSKDGQSKGYAFVLFDREQDCRAAYKAGEFMTVKGRKCVVDVERGRTVNDWKPRRFGGGLGGRHYTKLPVSKPGFGGPPQGPGFGGRPGGFRGGFNDRGGFRGGRQGPGFRGGGGGGYGGGGYGGGGGGYGGRGGLGYGDRPDGAPSGPRQGGGRGGGYGNANYEPLPPRGGGYRDRDRDFSVGQKRPHDGSGSSDEYRQRRRY